MVGSGRKAQRNKVKNSLRPHVGDTAQLSNAFPSVADVTSQTSARPD